MKSQRKVKNSGVSGADAPGAVAESEPGVDLNLGRRTFETPKEIKDFGG